MVDTHALPKVCVKMIAPIASMLHPLTYFLNSPRIHGTDAVVITSAVTWCVLAALASRSCP